MSVFKQPVKIKKEILDFLQPKEKTEINEVNKFLMKIMNATDPQPDITSVELELLKNNYNLFLGAILYQLNIDIFDDKQKKKLLSLYTKITDDNLKNRLQHDICTLMNITNPDIFPNFNCQNLKPNLQFNNDNIRTIGNFFFIILVYMSSSSVLDGGSRKTKKKRKASKPSKKSKKAKAPRRRRKSRKGKH